MEDFGEVELQPHKIRDSGFGQLKIISVDGGSELKLENIKYWRKYELLNCRCHVAAQKHRGIFDPNRTPNNFMI